MKQQKKFNIPSPTPIKHWIGKYNEHGEIGIEKTKKASYDGKYKQNVVEYMHTNHLSATQTAIHFKLSSGKYCNKNGNVYIMRKGHKHFMKSDVVEIKI